MSRVSDTYLAGVTASGYTPSVSSEFAMIGKVAYSVIREVVAKNPLGEFLKGNIENGDTIEQAVVKLVESSAYDSTGAGALNRDTTVKMAVRYFKNWTRKKFKTTVDMSFVNILKVPLPRKKLRLNWFPFCRSRIFTTCIKELKGFFLGGLLTEVMVQIIRLW